MRLRIQTFSPLPELKAWFIPQIQGNHETIFDLKLLLCRGVQHLRDSHVQAGDIVLLLEGFELLDDSPVSAVRDGDLIFVKGNLSSSVKDVNMNLGPVSNTLKRKRTNEELVKHYPPNNTGKKASDRRRTSEPSELEDDSSSDESSSSESSSESSTSSSTSSSSSPSDAPPPKKLSRTESNHRPSGVNHVPTLHVPPGQGKPSTHARNKRRKKKREEQKLSKAGLPPTQPDAPMGLSEANNLPLGPRIQKPVEPAPHPIPESPPLSEPASTIASSSKHSTQAFVSTQRESQINSEDTPASIDASKYTYITADQVMMGSLRNKNKKKGFKQSMLRPIPQKIVFANTDEQQDLSAAVTEEVVQPPSEPVETPTNVQSDPPPFTGRTPRLRRRMIPPSELQAMGKLPPNVFVTSVDVTGGMWSSSSRSKKRKKRKRQEWHDDYGGYDGENEWGAPEGWLGYGENEFAYDGADAGAAPTSTGEVIDWAQAEKIWDASPAIKNPEELTIGTLVGWKSLAINPQTFTPEMLLSLARVTNVSKSVAQEGIDAIQISVHPIERSGTSQAAFAFGLVESEDPNNADGYEMVYNWPNVLVAEWRVVQL